MEKTKSLISTILLILLFVLVLISRFWNFWGVDFTGDEANHVKKAASVAIGIRDLARFSNPDVAFKNIYIPILQHNHPPLEFLVLIPFGLFEPREFYARLVYVILGSLALVFSYFWVRKCLDKKLAGYFFILFGTSAYVIWWSQTAIYVSLAISAGVFLVLSIVYFHKKPNSQSLLFLVLSEAFGLLVFLDFIFYLPSLIWIIWEKRKFLKKSDFFKPFGLFFLTAGIFCSAYVTYALFFGPRFAGFNYVINAKLAGQANVIGNVKGYFLNFFGYPGVSTLLPFSLLTIIFMKKLHYFKYLYLVVIIYLAVFIFKSPTPFHYLASTFGIFLLLATYGLGLVGERTRPIILILVVVFNFIGFWPIFMGRRNPQFIDSSAPNNALVISKIAKKCIISDNETYISSNDPWKTAYYFGRPSTIEKDGTGARVATISDYLDGKLNQVVLIHVGDNLITNEQHAKLTEKAFSKIHLDRESVYIFKNCG